VANGFRVQKTGGGSGAENGPTGGKGPFATIWNAAHRHSLKVHNTVRGFCARLGDAVERRVGIKHEGFGRSEIGRSVDGKPKIDEKVVQSLAKQ
jgi:hypothetical protein